MPGSKARRYRPELMPRPVWIKRVVKTLVVIIGVLVLLIAGAIVFKNPLLKTTACWYLNSATGMKTTIAGFDFDFGSSSLVITNLQIHNNRAFGSGVFVDIPEIVCQVDNRNVAGGKVRFKEVRFNLSECNVVRNTNGVTNLDEMKQAVEKHVKKSRRSHTNAFEFGGIEKLVVSLGKINFTDLQQPENNTAVDLGIHEETAQNLKTEQELENWTMALLIRLAIQQSFNAEGKSSKSKPLEMMLKQLK
jgi:hypothetical protein